MSGDYEEIGGVRWLSVKGFADNHPETRTANFAMRLAKSGRVNLHDVNKWLRGTVYKVPLRFSEGGVRRLNPDVGWPADVLRHDIPEVYAGKSEEFLLELRKEFLKITPHEWEYPETDARGRKITAMQSALYVNRIPFTELVVGHLYLLKARNCHVGIFDRFPKCIYEWGQTGFTYARDKMGRVFLDEEHDFDGEHYATAIPLKDLGPAPEFADNEAKLAWLIEQSEAHDAEFKQFTGAAWGRLQGESGMSLPIADAVLLTDLDAVLGEIQARKDLRFKMVGTLYPNVVVDEIGQLVQRYEELGGTRLSDALYERQRKERD